MQVTSVPKPSDFEDLACEFEKVGHWLANVIGAIHRVHLKMKLTEERRFEPSFINYKQFHSLHLKVSSVPINLIFWYWSIVAAQIQDIDSSTF